MLAISPIEGHVERYILRYNFTLSVQCHARYDIMLSARE